MPGTRNTVVKEKWNTDKAPGTPQSEPLIAAFYVKGMSHKLKHQTILNVWLLLSPISADQFLEIFYALSLFLTIQSYRNTVRTACIITTM